MTRTTPHNLDAEQSLLGAMLLSRAAIDTAAETGLTPDSFYKPAHGHIYEAITSLSAQGEPVDPVTVAEELRRADLLDAIGGPATLIALQAGTPATTSASRYARIIEEHALLRAMIGAATEITELGYSLPDDVPKALDHAEHLMFQVAEHRQTDTTSRIHDLLAQTIDVLEARYTNNHQITGTPTGYTDLDDLTAGLQPGALTVIGARPGMGKTSFALGIAHHAATNQQPVLFFSMEMSRVELTQRLLCADARVDSTKVRNGQLSDADWTRISKSVGTLSNAPLWIDDNPHVTTMEIRSKARRLTQQAGQLGLVIIDYIQLMSGSGPRAESRQIEVAEISRNLKILARELNCPVVALAQLNRGLEQRADKRPMLADLRESGSLEQDADIVCFLYRDEMYNPDTPDRGTAEVLVAKHRSGPTGLIRLAFLDQYTKFANMARP